MQSPVPDANGYYHFVYKTTLEGSDKYYVGRRSTKKLNDGYFGSGKWVKSLKDTGRKGDLRRVIIAFAVDATDLRRLEQETIDAHFGLPGCMNYDISSCGFLSGENHPMYRKSHTLESRHKMSSSQRATWDDDKRRFFSVKFSGEDNPFYGRSHSEKSKELISCYRSSLSGRKYSEEHRKNISKSLTGKIRSEEHRKNLSLALAGEKHHFYGTKRPEHSKAMSKIFKFYSPIGELVVVESLKEFCLNNKLTYSIMRELYHGVYKAPRSGNNLKTYKGWRSANPALIYA